MKPLKLLAGGLIVIFGLLNAKCTQDKNIKSETTEKVNLKFKNGRVCCEGVRKVMTKNSDVTIDKIGLWKFYYPNGNIESVHEYSDNGNLLNVQFYFPTGSIEIWKEYNEDGELLNQKTYSIDSTLIYSSVKKDNVYFSTFYYQNGNPETEVIAEINPETEEDENPNETYKYYYPNGQPFKHVEYIDGIAEGKSRIWDESGELMIEFKYKNGEIVIE